MIYRFADRTSGFAPYIKGLHNVCTYARVPELAERYQRNRTRGAGKMSNSLKDTSQLWTIGTLRTHEQSGTLQRPKLLLQRRDRKVTYLVQEYSQTAQLDC